MGKKLLLPVSWILAPLVEQLYVFLLDATRLDSDSITINAPMVGDLKMRIIDRDFPKTIKFETENSPIPFKFWIQLLPTGEFSCKMKLTIKAELNMFIKGMVKKPLQEGIEKIADALAMIPYQD